MTKEHAKSDQLKALADKLKKQFDDALAAPLPEEIERLLEEIEQDKKDLNKFTPVLSAA